MKAKFCKARNGFDIILTPIRRNILADDFLRDVDNVLIEPAGVESQDPVLLGCVNTSNNLPKWFPFKVQYQFSNCEYIVNKLWLIVNNRRIIFIVDGHAHDLATLYATYSRLRGEAVPMDKKRNSEPQKASKPCEQSAITSSVP